MVTLLVALLCLKKERAMHKKVLPDPTSFWNRDEGVAVVYRQRKADLIKNISEKAKAAGVSDTVVRGIVASLSEELDSSAPQKN